MIKSWLELDYRAQHAHCDCGRINIFNAQVAVTYELIEVQYETPYLKLVKTLCDQVLSFSNHIKLNKH